MPEPAPPTAPPFLLRRSVFPSFWCARIASSLGYQMLSVAVGWQIYEITGRAFDLGMIGLVQFIPSVVLALPAGHCADQFERRRIVLIGQIVEWFAIVALTILTFTGRVHEAGILALVFVVSVAKAFEFPALQSMLPSLVPAEVLPRAMAASASAFQTAMIVGPALGGVLYAAFGPGVVYAVTALLYLVAATLMARLKVVQVVRAREPVTLATLFAGVTFIRQRRDILGVISLDLFAVLLGGATALLPIFARDLLHTGPRGLGLLRAAPAVGALLTSLWLARHQLQRRVGMTMFAAVAGFGVATLAFAVSTSLALSLAALFALGAFDMVSVVIRSALVQLDTPDAMRGRVSAVNAIFINTSNQLGEFESGMTAAWMGAVPATVVGGIGTLVVVGVWMWMFPSLRRRQRLQGESTPPEPTPAPPTTSVI
jgi:MFS family permease